MSEKYKHTPGTISPFFKRTSMYQNRQIRSYLKRVRRRMKRRQRYFLYGMTLAVALYLASIWQLRERIWSIQKMDTIEYEVPEWGWEENGQSGDSAAEKRENQGSSTRILFHLKTGELEILHERTKSEENRADYRR